MKQVALEQMEQDISRALGDLVTMQLEPAFPGKTHKTRQDINSLARLWVEYKRLRSEDEADLAAQDARFEREFADAIADVDAHRDELDQQNALRRGEA